MTERLSACLSCNSEQSHLHPLKFKKKTEQIPSTHFTQPIIRPVPKLASLPLVVSTHPNNTSLSSLTSSMNSSKKQIPNLQQQ